MPTPRVDVEDVLSGGFDVGFDELTSAVQSYLERAHVHWSQHLDSSDYSDDVLDQIEIELTRHLIRSEPGPEREVARSKVGDSTREFSGAFGAGLQATTHGQEADELSGGELSQAGQHSASFEVF